MSEENGSERYSVRGVAVNVVAVIRHLKRRFCVHRPVEKDGQRRRSGWMLSLDGVPMVLLEECKQEDAVTWFREGVKRAVTPKELDAAIAKVTPDELLVKRLVD